MSRSLAIVALLLSVALAGCAAEESAPAEDQAGGPPDGAPEADPFVNLTFGATQRDEELWFNGTFTAGESSGPGGSAWQRASQPVPGRHHHSLEDAVPVGQLTWIIVDVEVSAQDGAFDVWLGLPNNQIYMWREADASAFEQGFEAMVLRTSPDPIDVVVAYTHPATAAEVPYTVRALGWGVVDWMPEAVPVAVPLLGENATLRVELWEKTLDAELLVYDPSDGFVGRLQPEDGVIEFVRTAAMPAGEYVFMLEEGAWAERAAVHDPDQDVPMARVLHPQMECCEAVTSNSGSVTWDFSTWTVPLQVGIGWTGGVASQGVSASLLSPSGDRVAAASGEAGMQLNAGWSWTDTTMGAEGLAQGRYEAEVSFDEYASDEDLQAFHWIVYYQR